MQPPNTWPERFMAALVLTDRAMALFLLVMVFLGGMIVGAGFTTSRRADDVQRRLAETIARGPTLSQRLDAIEHRLQAIEQRLSP